MSLAIQKYPEQENSGVSKQEFELALQKLWKQVHQLEDSVSQKADGVVLTMVLSHRKEMEALQEKLTIMQEQLNLQGLPNFKKEEQLVEEKPQKRNFFRKLFQT